MCVYIPVYHVCMCVCVCVCSCAQRRVFLVFICASTCVYVHVQSPLVPLDKRRYKEQVLIVKAEKGLILLSHTHTYKHTHTTCGYTHTSMPTQTIS